MERITPSGFAAVARRLGAAAHAAGLEVPAFRSPPRVIGAARTLRRYPGGSVVSVRIVGRPGADVARDMVEGVLRANRVPADTAPRLRLGLLAVLEPAGPIPAGAPTAVASRSRSLAAPARVAERKTQAA